MPAISKDADYLICAVYKSYLGKRKNGQSKEDAKMIGGSDTIQEAMMPEWSIADVDDTCRELHTARLLNCFYADDTVYHTSLTDAGIVYMESRFSGKFDTILDYMAKIKASIPFA